MKIFKFLLLLILPISIFSQEQSISADFDGDQIADRVYVDDNSGTVTYELSSQKFKKIITEDYLDSGEISLKKKKNGFEIGVNQMRAGNSFQFRYEKSNGKMRLIGMQRYEFGPANNDGSGKSSVNLLTNNYIAEWNHYDLDKSELIKIPSIKKKMVLPKAYFNDLKNVYSLYLDQDIKYYRSEKKKMQKSKN
ncbi:hypothetical protein [Frigoriflavimonas asaccharolytica]|uniref:Uncharacterized protein n=1 Tax=Frigoriflavimonas asaccharolytica TaxID=2735899 RepID=A0A8J8K7M6_9FLAO|nr:hypothetical protein [Frigoriflavimonas asaccharolytica]NRS91636.1 hypothetical protein [Frigoriflavimonas asaccharolytica]